MTPGTTGCARCDATRSGGGLLPFGSRLGLVTKARDPVERSFL